MKRKIFLIALTLALLVTAIVGISALAGETPTAEIKYQNLSYKSNVAMKYAVEATNIPDGATVGVRVRKDSPTSETAYEANFEGYTTIEGRPHLVFDLSAMSAAEMTVNLYAEAYVEVGGEEVYTGSVKRSSVLEYSYKILGKIPGGKEVSADVKTMIAAMLRYGGAVQQLRGTNLDRLASDEFVFIALQSGRFSDGYTEGLYPVGGKVTIVADVKENADFTAWKDSAGATVSQSETYELTVTEAETYIATYKFDNVIYRVNGGTLEEKPSYIPGEALTLPTPEREGYIFSGWFTSETFEVSTAISEIPADATGEYVLYAKWNKIVSELDASGIAGVSYGNNSAADSELVLDEAANVLTVVQGKSKLSQLTKNGNLVGALDGERRITITVTLSKVTGENVPASTFRLRRATKFSGEIPVLNLFQTDATGSVTLGGDKASVITVLNDKPTTFSIVVDFDKGTLSAYSDRGAELAICNIKISTSTEYDTLDKYLSLLTGTEWQWTFSNDTKRITKINAHAISVYAGNSAHKTDGDGYTDEERAAMLEELKDKLSEQRTALSAIDIFNNPTEDITSLIANESTRNKWGTAPTTPLDEHPRLLFTKDDLPSMREVLNGSSNSVIRFKSYLRSAVEGILPEMGEFSGDTTKNSSNYSAAILETILAKALGYQLYGEERYGYEAIYAIKNYLNTLDIQYITSDQYREYGHVMFGAACVYDWCYDLLNDTDKTQIIAAVEKAICTGKNEKGVKMEVGFPPTGQGSMTGHGSEYQILRDYLAFALVVYQENESWWNYIGARFYNDYVVSRNGYYVTGIASQGTSYVGARHTSALFSAWIAEVGTKAGTNPYVNMEKTVRSYVGYEFAPDRIFSDGDSSVNQSLSVLRDQSFLAAMLFDDATLLATGNHILGNTAYAASSQGLTNVPYIIILGRLDVEPAEDRHEDLDLIQYNGAPLGQYVIRERWNDPDSAAVFMKLKERSTGNHEHDDAGTFQIYYKALLSGDSGVYNNYGHAHTQYYHQATIAHNGLIIFDSSKWNPSGADSDKWYSGSQRTMSEASTYALWLSESKYDTGTITGHQHGYSDDAETSPLYAYLAGDITKAYDSATVDYVGRRMLTVYTGNAAFPMVFFVYDDIESDSADYEKRFLLQINSADEPTVEGNTVTTVNGDGKLVLTSLSSGVTINKVGGRVYTESGSYDPDNSTNFLINGVNCKTLDGKDDKHWGRVEIVAPAEKKAEFMNVLYVSDAAETETAPAISKISADGVSGATFGNVAAVFATSREREDSVISFTTQGSGTVSYYVSGVAAGEWTYSVNGTDVGTATATEDGGLLVFEAPAGYVTLKHDSVLIYADFETSAEGTLNRGTTISGVTFGNKDAPTLMKVGTYNGNKYVEMQADTDIGTKMYNSNNLKNALGGEKKVSFELELAKGEDTGLGTLPISLRIRSANTASSTNPYVVIMSVTSGGTVKVNNKTVATLTSEFTTVRFVVDFSDPNGDGKLVLTSYDENGDVINTSLASPISGYTPSEYYDILTAYFFDCQAYNGEGTIRIGKFAMYKGNAFAK